MKAVNRPFHGYRIVAICFIGMMLLMGTQTVFGVFFKPIVTELGWTRAVTSGAVSLSLLVGGVMSIVMGSLNDRVGPRVVMTIYGLLATLGYLLMSGVQHPWQLYLFFGIIIGASSNTFAPLLSTVARWFAARRGMMTGVVFAGAGVGMLVLPLIFERLIAACGWRDTFMIIGGVILVVIVTTAQFLKRDPQQIGQNPYGADDTTEAAMKPQKDFTLREAAGTAPFWMFVVTLMLYGFCFFSLQLHLAPYVTDLGFSPGLAAAILATIGGATIVGQVGLGSAGDRLGYRPTFLIGMVCVTLAIVVLLLSQQLWALFLCAALLGLGFGDCSTVESPIAAWLFGLKSHGLILGCFSCAFTVGAAVGPWLSGYIFDVSGGYRDAFIIAAVLAVIAVTLTLFLKQPSEKEVV